MTINVVFALWLARAATAKLSIVAAIAALDLVLTAHSTEGIGGLGPEWATFAQGAARTVFSFTTGVIIARLRQAPVRRSALAVVLTLFLGVLLFVQVEGPTQIFYDRIVVIVASPLLVWLGSSMTPPRTLTRASEVLGDLSYPLYAIHVPIYIWFDHIATGGGNVHGAAWIIGWKLAAVVVIVPAAWALGRFVDTPLRRRLMAFFEGRRGT